MAQFASDAFTNAAGTTLPTHNAAWTLHPSYTGGGVITDADRARNSASGGTGAVYYHSGAPATADYSVAADLFFKEANGGTAHSGVTGRTDTAAHTMYMARYGGGANDRWELLKIVAGTSTLLGSSAEAITDETSHNVKLEMVGTAIKLYKDGGGVATVSVTDTDITAAGKSGLWLYNSASANNTTGIHPDNFSGDDVASGITAALTGQSITIAQGSMVADITAPLTGHNIPLAQGTVTVDPGGVTAALTGQSASVALGNVSPVVTVGITGQSIPLSLGTLVPAFERAITGQGVTTSLGSVVAAVAPALTGQSITVSTGAVSVGGDIVRALTGQSLSISQGNVLIPGAVIQEEITYAPPRKTRAPNFAPRKEPAKPEAKKKPKAKAEPKPEPRNRLRMANELIMPDTMLDLMQKRREQQAIERQHLYNIRARAALLAA